MTAGQGSIEYVGKISLDASELMKVLGMGGGAGGGGGGAGAAGGPPTAGDLKQQQNIQKGMIKAHKDPSFMSIFKPLVALEGVKSLVANSRVANAYLGSMGKMFSAAIDLLLLPFTPIFNLLMVAMSKLIAWLIDSGVLEWIGEGVENLVKMMDWAWNALKDIASAIANFGKMMWEAAPEWLKTGLKAIAKVAEKIADVLHLGDIAKTVAAGAAVLGTAAMMPIIGGPIRAGLGLAARGVGALGMGAFGMARGGGGGGGGMQMGLPGFGMGGGGGGGMMARMGLSGGRGLFGANRFVSGMGMGIGATGLNMAAGGRSDIWGSAARVGSMAGYGAMMGSPFGPMGMGIGAGVGGAVGLAAELGVPGAGAVTGLFGVNKPKSGGEGGTTSTGDVKNIGTQNITMNIYVKDKEMAREIMSHADEEMTASAEAGV